MSACFGCWFLSGGACWCTVRWSIVLVGVCYGGVWTSCVEIGPLLVSPGLGNTHLEALCDGPKPTSTSTLKIFTLSVFVCGERPKKYSMSRRWRYMSHVFFMISPVQKINLAWIRTLVRAVLGKSGILAKKIKKKKRLQHLSFAYGHPLHYSVRLSQA